jgi:hypothetical protein
MGAQELHYELGERKALLLGRGSGPAGRPQTAQRVGEGQDKLIASRFQRAGAPHAQPAPGAGVREKNILRTENK